MISDLINAVKKKDQLRWSSNEVLALIKIHCPFNLQLVNAFSGDRWLWYKDEVLAEITKDGLYS